MGIYYQPLSNFLDRYRRELFNLPSNIKIGLIIRQVEQGGPADRAGIQQGDVIVAFNGHKIKDTISFRKYLYHTLNPGQKVKLTIYRNKKKTTVMMTLGKESLHR